MPDWRHAQAASNHQDAINLLAKETDKPLEDVQAIYAKELARLELDARGLVFPLPRAQDFNCSLTSCRQRSNVHAIACFRKRNIPH